MLYRSPFRSFSWHNAQARSVTSQCSGLFFFVVVAVYRIYSRHRMWRFTKESGFYVLHTPFTHHIISSAVCQLFGFVMRFSHFCTFDQYANFSLLLLFLLFVFFLLYNRACSAVDVAANFCYPALCIAVRFFISRFLIRRTDSSYVLYSIAWTKTRRMGECALSIHIMCYH